jgi:hypothetical protein
MVAEINSAKFWLVVIEVLVPWYRARRWVGAQLPLRKGEVEGSQGIAADHIDAALRKIIGLRLQNRLGRAVNIQRSLLRLAICSVRYLHRFLLREKRRCCQGLCLDLIATN